MANINQEPRDENGRQHGEWLIYYRNGQLRYRSNYVHGVMHGLFEGYPYNGILWSRGHWNMGMKVGYWYYLYKKQYYLCLI